MEARESPREERPLEEGSWDGKTVLTVGALSFVLLNLTGMLIRLYDQMQLEPGQQLPEPYDLDWRHVLGQGPGQIACWILAILMVRFVDPVSGLRIEISGAVPKPPPGTLIAPSTPTRKSWSLGAPSGCMWATP